MGVGTFLQGFQRGQAECLVLLRDYVANEGRCPSNMYFVAKIATSGCGRIRKFCSPKAVLLLMNRGAIGLRIELSCAPHKEITQRAREYPQHTQSGVFLVGPGLQQLICFVQRAQALFRFVLHPQQERRMCAQLPRAGWKVRHAAGRHYFAGHIDYAVGYIFIQIAQRRAARETRYDRRDIARTDAASGKQQLQVERAREGFGEMRIQCHAVQHLARVDAYTVAAQRVDQREKIGARRLRRSGACLEFPRDGVCQQSFVIGGEFPGGDLRADARGSGERRFGGGAVAVEDVVDSLRQAKSHTHTAPCTPCEQRMPVKQQEDCQIAAVAADEMREFREAGEFGAQRFTESQRRDTMIRRIMRHEARVAVRATSKGRQRKKTDVPRRNSRNAGGVSTAPMGAGGGRDDGDS